MTRVATLFRRYGLDALIVLTALGGVLDVAAPA